MTEVLVFGSPERLFGPRASTILKYTLTVVDKQFVGTPEERLKTRHHELTIEGLHSVLEVEAGVARAKIENVLFACALSHVSDRIRRGQLSATESLVIDDNYSDKSRLRDRQDDPVLVGVAVDIDVPEPQRRIGFAPEGDNQ